jgi:hypothetical protein
MRLLQGRTTVEAAHIVNTVRAQAERTDAGEAIPLRNAPPTGNPATPWEVVASAREPRRATKDLLVEMCMQLEHQGLDSAEPNLLLACFQEADHFTPAARSR